MYVGEMNEFPWGVLRVRGRRRRASCHGALVLSPGSLCLSRILVLSLLLDRSQIPANATYALSTLKSLAWREPF